MKQIKTVIARRDYEAQFDEKVNKALADGWKLVKRFLAPSEAHSSLTMQYHPIWVAYLEKEVPDEKV